MISLTELRAMLKENKIRGNLQYSKSELVDVLVKRGLLPETMNITTITSLPVREDTTKEINPKFNFLKYIRNSPKKVEIRDMETGEIIVCSSMYKVAKKFNQQSRLIYTYDGKVWRNRYAIKVLTESECFLNLNMFVHNMNILRFFSKSQSFWYRQTEMTTSCLK